jgi:hypothetical protein
MSKDFSSCNTKSDWLQIENSFKNYGLKVRLKLEDTRVLIDVESSINSDEHYIQYIANYCKSLIVNWVTGSYKISSYQLFGILATAAGIKVSPTTSDTGPLVDSWYFIYAWLDDMGISYGNVLPQFKKQYPGCSSIVLTTSNDAESQIDVSVVDDGNIGDFGQLNIHGAVIDLDNSFIQSGV